MCNVHFSQRILKLHELVTNMRCAPKCLPTFGVLTFHTVINIHGW
jgi:hypothetical protein